MATTRPNVVFVLTDDQGPWAMGCAGNEEIRTPNLDRLAAGGVRFENFFCTSPVCSPARASLMTGRIPSQHGVIDWISQGASGMPQLQKYLDGMTCYTDVLAANGYVCGISGKWHLGGSLEPQHGFSHWFVLPRGFSTYVDANVCVDGQIVQHKGYLTDVITNNALGFIEKNKKGGGRPFYLSVNYTAPHFPWVGHPQEIVDSYDSCAFRTCPQDEPPHPWSIPHSRKLMGDREALKGYFAATTAMDLGVGRILDQLENLGLRENTLVIFSSDNGYSCGHHGFWHKGNGTIPLNMYENSVKVPTIFSHPGKLPAGLVNRALVSQYDFMPTLLEYLGMQGPGDDAGYTPRPGKSFLRTLQGTTDQAAEHVVVYDEYGPVRMIRTPEWKYVHRYPYGPHELYDMVRDPDERKNLVDDKSSVSVVVEMRKRLVKWFDRYVIPSLDGARSPVDGGGQIQRIDETCAVEEAFEKLE
ncbi:MAG: sulfatase-like hydrolase/transferase [Phycisphaerales bacterium]|nr:sulfatase-like hydrolase/transferase [Phycisphaerales bacterium]